MRRLIKPVRRALVSFTTLASVGLLAHTAHAVDCQTDLTNQVFIYGSTASAPLWGPLAVALASNATPPTIVYGGAGSCTGVTALTGAPLTAGAFTYYNGTTGVAGAACTTLTTQIADLGVSDVFPTSCTGITAATLTAASVQDFDNFLVQSMNFVVPGSDAAAPKTISAEAAYVAFGLGGVGTGIPTDFPWIATFNTPVPPALPVSTNFFVRNGSSGTQIMLGKAIGVDAARWIGKDEGGSGAVITAISNGPHGSIGILVSGDVEAHPTVIHKLAFQAKGQTCAFYPDSASNAHDKINVREGRYDVWGPLHVLAKVTGGVPSATAKLVLDGLATPNLAVLTGEINSAVTPMCAMHVSRASEMGAMSSFQPAKSCGCYFDLVTTGATTCTPCSTGADCSTDAPACNYGYCEVQ